jgi:hypothetical protein
MKLCCLGQPGGNGTVGFDPPCSPWCHIQATESGIGQAFDAFRDCLVDGGNQSSIAGILCSGGSSEDDESGARPAGSLDGNKKAFGLMFALLLLGFLAGGL